MVSGDAVVVSSTGQLGIAMSSARYKHDIRDMGGASSALLKLRPVIFRYNHDPSDTLQYGLVAEEVAKSYPELVSYGPDGKPKRVRYLELSAMLLNELQKQNRALQEQTMVNARQADQNRKLAKQVAKLTANQERERVAFERRFETLERVSAAKASDAKLAAAFNR